MMARMVGRIILAGLLLDEGVLDFPFRKGEENPYLFSYGNNILD